MAQLARRCAGAVVAFDFDARGADRAAARPTRASRRHRGPAAAAGRVLPWQCSGRAVADVRGRLGFEPRYVVGNHGAEGLRWPGEDDQHEALAGLRQRLHEQQQELSSAGITVEDKGGSLALHYRLARDRQQALSLLELLHRRAEWRVFGGKMVVNVAPAAAPDKADAVMALAAHCGAECAFFAGDDVNDEPVFIAAPAHWLTVRIGREDPSSRAMFFLDSHSEMGLMLQRMLDLLAVPPGQPSAND